MQIRQLRINNFRGIAASAVPSYERGVVRFLRDDLCSGPANTKQIEPMLNHDIILNHIDGL